jgi:phosphoribosylcarboxyaminoimidazole (NCAIR) mutase
MKSLAMILLGVGGVVALAAIVAKMTNGPVVGSKPLTILNFANSCFLLAIGLLLAEEKK